MKAPFPWFGGKRRVAHVVWDRFGDVASYNEPFAGSLAVLLERPHPPRIETVNDLDAHLANFWRALKSAPDEVAEHADWPVNEADLHSRHRWLVSVANSTTDKVTSDPDFFDAKIAGWWVWGQCLWIGSGWCQRPEWTGRANAGRVARGVHKRDRNGQGTVHQNRRPHMSTPQGVEAHSGRRWQGGGQAGGSGVHAPTLTRQLPQLSGDGSGAQRGCLGEGVKSVGLYNYMRQLATRLRHVRVCCGDWARVLTPSVTTYIGVTGVFLDPPYSHDLRERCYSEDHDISGDVRKWAIEHGDDLKMRIALCGYEGEHEMPDSWDCVAWKAHGGYSRSERGKANRSRERIWFSPGCLKPTQPELQIS